MNLKEPPLWNSKVKNNGKKFYKHNIRNISLFMGWNES